MRDTGRFAEVKTDLSVYRDRCVFLEAVSIA